MSLANKYRPQIFDQLIDQVHIIDILKYQVANGQCSQTYIFFGPRGTGKTSTARILSKAINCLQTQDGNPCNSCDNCRIINANKSVDFVEIDAASHTGVDNIREEIVSKASYPPLGLKKKIYLIDEVHMLSKGAFNSLLKIMEETPEYIVFVLATTEINKVPETILSRCQIFNFTKVIATDMVKHLAYICTQEHIAYELEALELITSISDGCVRDAVKYVDQVSVGGIISVEHTMRYIGIANQTMIQDFLQSLREPDFDKILRHVDEINTRGIDLSNYSKQVLHYIDMHYTEDITHMSQYAELFSNILTQQKYYPNPLLAYKVELWKYYQKFHSLDDHNITSKKGTSLMQDHQQDDIKERGSTRGDTVMAQDGYNTEQDSQTIAEQNPQVSTQKETKDASKDTRKIEKDTKNHHQPGKDHEAIHNLHDLLYQASKESLQKIIGQAGKFVQSDENHITLMMIDSGKMAMIRRPDTIKYFEQLITSVLGKTYSFDIIYQDPQALLDQSL